MPVEVGEFAMGGFIALLLGVVLLAVLRYAHRKGHLRGRTTGYIMAAIAGIIILYLLGVTFFPARR